MVRGSPDLSAGPGGGASAAPALASATASPFFQMDVRSASRKLALTVTTVGRDYRGVFEAIWIGGAIGGWLRW
jgi:hypothetical protein